MNKLVSIDYANVITISPPTYGHKINQKFTWRRESRGQGATLGFPGSPVETPSSWSR